MLNLSPELLLARIFTLIIAFTVHEFAHAWTANELGDDTPRLAGRLTLNPLAHLDVLGSLMLVLAGFGWAKPVPVNPYALQRRTPAGMMIVAAAGPVSNVGLALLASIPFLLGLVSVSSSILAVFVADFIFLNLVLFFFNLIPIFPLDGEKVLTYFLPPSGQAFLAQVRPYGPILLAMLVILSSRSGLNVLDIIVRGPALGISNFLVS
ncbi:MAG: ywhC [Anaerolineales bacterium]|jgi:Zn-dependent protease|nr:ywhC [Anaerolineales bacterium]